MSAWHRRSEGLLPFDGNVIVTFLFFAITRLPMIRTSIRRFKVAYAAGDNYLRTDVSGEATSDGLLVLLTRFPVEIRHMASMCLFVLFRCCDDLLDLTILAAHIEHIATVTLGRIFALLRRLRNGLD